MRYLLPLLLLLAPPLFATESESSQLCEIVDYELEQGVAFGIITEEERTEVYIRCLVNYS